MTTALDTLATNGIALINWFRKKLTDPLNLDRIPVIGIPAYGWGMSGVLQAGNPNLAVGLDATFDRQMQVHTVQFDGLDNDLNTGLGINPITEAEITWGVNGVPVRRVVNVQDGASISAPAQGVSVRVFDRTIGGTGTEYRIGITVTPGVRANIQQPPTLRMDGRITATGALVQFNATLAAGQDVVWTIPKNAGAISVYHVAQSLDPAVNLTDASLSARYSNAVATTLKRHGFSAFNRWVPLPLSARTITVVNDTAVSVATSAILGIEG